MKIIRFGKDLLLIICAVGIFCCAIFAVTQRADFLVVTSRSMEPTFKAGDTLVTSMISSGDIKKNQVLVLPYPDSPKQLYSHRVVEIKENADNIVVRTKGDGNPRPDAWQLQITSSKVPRVIAVFPTAAIFNGLIPRSTILFALTSFGLSLLIIATLRFALNSLRD